MKRLCFFFSYLLPGSPFWKPENVPGKIRNRRLIVSCARFLQIASICILIPSPTGIHARQDDAGTVYRVAIDKTYAPYEFIDLDGGIKGFTPDLLREIGRSLHITFLFIPMDLSEAVTELAEGHIDLVNMIRTPTRMGAYEFSQPHSYIRQAIFRHASARGIHDLKSLTGHRVALQLNDISFEMLANRTDFQHFEVQSREEGFLLLNAGKVDAFLAADLAGRELILDYGLNNVEPAAVGLFPRDFCFAARKGNRKLIGLLNAGLREAKASGRYAKIAENWLTTESHEHNWLTTHWRSVAGLIFVLMAILAGFVVWNILLRRAVESQTGDLLESRNSLNEAQRIARIGSWEWDVHSNSLYWSDETFRIFGIDPEKFTAELDVFLEAVHREDRQRVRQSIDEAVRNGTPEWTIDYRIIRTDGELRYLHEEARLIFAPDGQIVKRVGTVQDITEQKLREDELQRYRDHLEEEVHRRTQELRLASEASEAANRAKSVFLAKVSHELRTPLNAILGFSAILRREPDLTGGQRENLDIINHSGEHLLALINDVLEIARIESGRMQLKPTPFDLVNMVREVTDLMSIRAREKGLQLEVDLSSIFPRYIKSDEARLRQVLLNLTSNAVKYTMEGNITVRLHLAENAPQHLVIEVEDTGPGISAKDQQRLFEPFLQLDEGKEQKGTGLGLTITRQFVKLMKGEITLESTPGKGSLFRIELPFEAAAKSDILELEPTIHREIIGLAPGQPHYRILIAEDQRENQLLLMQLMSNLGFDVKLAENGTECVQIFEQWHPHLIWMDRRMPVMDGNEATRRIRELPSGNRVKIVAVTASVFRENRKEMLDAGMDDFLSKPYRFEEVCECLSRQLGVRYIYRSTPETRQEPTKLTSAMLAVLPPEVQNELRTALIHLESEAIAAAIRRIETYDQTLAKVLSRITESFDYSTILKALDEIQ